MLSSSPAEKVVGALLGFAICVGSTAASAATTAPVPSISPMVALSAFAAAGSGNILCATAVQGAATVSAAAQAAPGSGCVLPIVDQPVPVAQQVAPEAYVPAPQGRIGLLPLLGGLAAIVGLAALLMINDNDGEIRLPPISPD